MLDNLDGDISFVQQAEHVGDLLFIAFGVNVQFAERTVEVWLILPCRMLMVRA